MSDQPNPPSRRGREQQEQRDAAAEAQLAAADSVSATLSTEVEKLYHVLGVLNQSTAHFCEMMDQQQKDLRGEINALTTSLNRASKSSTRLGCILIIIAIIAGIIAVPSALKNLHDLGYFGSTTQTDPPKTGGK